MAGRARDDGDLDLSRWPRAERSPRAARIKTPSFQSRLDQLAELAKTVLELELRYLQVKHNAPDGTGRGEIELVVGVSLVERELERLHSNRSMGLLPAPLRASWEQMGMSTPDKVFTEIQLNKYTAEARAAIQKIQDLLASNAVTIDPQPWMERPSVANRCSVRALKADRICVKSMNLNVDDCADDLYDSIPAPAYRAEIKNSRERQTTEQYLAIQAKLRAAQEAKWPGARAAMDQQPPTSSMRDDPLPGAI